MAESPPEENRTAEVGPTPNLAAFVLSVATEEQPVTVTGGGTTAQCADSCNFAYIAGTALTLTAGLQNLADCLRFSSWSGACSGQGRTCGLVINSDLSTTALYSRIAGCVPQ
ncbi:MAG TPA: hypothetical protein VF469_17450 [Kofleriaceae bacterium]